MNGAVRAQTLIRISVGGSGERYARYARADSSGWRVASFFLEVAFRLEKPTAKLLNDAFYAIFYCQIKMLSWSDPD